MHEPACRLAGCLMLAAGALVACGGGGSVSVGWAPPGPVAADGLLKVSLADGQACGYDAVHVSVAKVRVHHNAGAGPDDAGWTDISVKPPRKINLLSLTNGALDVLGTVSLPAGHYGQVLLVLGTGNLANSVIARGGAERSLDLSAVAQDGIRVEGRFDVLAGQQADIVIEVDACRSVLGSGTGNYALRPLVKLVPALLNGIAGVVSPAILNRNVVLSAQQNGVVLASTVPNAGSGHFLLARLAPGNYDVVVTGAGSTASVVGGVPVASTTSITALSTAAAPLTLASGPTGAISGTVVLSPASAAVGAHVAAKLAIMPGPTVTINDAGADVLTGAYAIDKLPLNAPDYAVYGAGLPLVFAAAATVLPGVASYQVEASAPGYAPRSYFSAVNIASADASNINFTLLP